MTVPAADAGAVGVPSPRAVGTIIVPVIAAAAAGMRLQLASGITPALVLAVLLLPVWIGALRSYRLARPIMALGAGAVAWGAAVTVTDANRSTSSSLLIAETMTLLSMLGGLGLLLWARTLISDTAVVVAFAMGALVNIGITGGNPVNLWKFSLAYPVAFLLLGVAMRFGRFWELLVLAFVAAVSAVSDSRSFTSFALAAAVLVVLQLRPGQATKPRPWQALIGLATLALALVALMQALILDGALGAAAAQRSAAQLSASGSLLTGGRPELGAAVALIGQQPWGYGSGTLPSSTDVLIAKTGMSELHYDANNGYVENYMFGSQYEVHSVLGDLWIRFGPLGATFSLLLLCGAIYAVAVRFSLRTASGLVALLTTLGIWDTFFSPLLTSYNTLALMFALAALPTAAAAATATAATATPGPQRRAPRGR